MIDITNQIEAIDRDVTRREGADGEEVAVLIRPSYDAPSADVWDALTDPERVKRWFYPVSGDLRVGGTFQLEGNAGGEIVRCEPPHLLRVTFGGPTSLVELRLSSEGEDRTVLELEHTVPIDIAMNGAGSLYVGPGWDGAFVSLDLYLHHVVADDPIAAANSRGVGAVQAICARLDRGSGSLEHRYHRRDRRGRRDVVRHVRTGVRRRNLRLKGVRQRPAASQPGSGSPNFSSR